MQSEPIDQNLFTDGNLHPLELLSFDLVHNDESRIWIGKSNLIIETKTFQKRDKELGDWVVNIEERKSLSGTILFSRITGNIRLLKEFNQIERSIKSHQRFWTFGKSKKSINKYYLIKPAIDSGDLENLLLNLTEIHLDINVEGGLVKFELNSEVFPKDYYQLIIQTLALSAF